MTESLNAQVYTLFSEGRYDEALPLAEATVARAREVLGESHLEYGSAAMRLAALYHVAGKHEEAERLFLVGCDIRLHHLGSDDPLYTNSLSNLANHYYVTGRYEETETLRVRPDHWCLTLRKTNGFLRGHRSSRQYQSSTINTFPNASKRIQSHKKIRRRPCRW